MRGKRCPTCKRPLKRGNPANARYWLLLHRMADHWKPNGKQFSAEVWHLESKRRFLGCEEYKLPGGKTFLIPNSSANLDADLFSDYMTKVEAWANEHGIFLEDMEGA